MFNFGRNKVSENDPQDYINSLMKYKSKIQQSSFGEKKNDITPEDIEQIANLLFKLGKQPSSEFRTAIDTPMIQRMEYIKEINTQDDLVNMLVSTVCNEFVYQDIINSIIKNYLTDPYQFTIPFSLLDNDGFIVKNQHNIDNGIKELYTVSSGLYSEDELISHLRRENLLALCKSNISRFICAQIYRKINEKDETNALHYMLQDVFTVHATLFHEAFVSIIDSYAELSVDDFLRR